MHHEPIKKYSTVATHASVSTSITMQLSYTKENVYLLRAFDVYF